MNIKLLSVGRQTVDIESWWLWLIWLNVFIGKLNLTQAIEVKLQYLPICPLLVWQSKSVRSSSYIKIKHLLITAIIFRTW